MDINTLVNCGVPLLFTAGFVLGYFYYHKHGWKPNGDLTETDKEFLTFTAFVCGVVGGFTALAIGVMLFMAFL